MNRTLCFRILGALAAASCAFADITGSVTLTANQILNLDTGTASAAGPGDVLWNGTSLTPQGKATAEAVGAAGDIGFNTETEAVLNGLKGIATGAAIPAGKLAVNDLIAVYTNGGHAAKVLVTSNSGGSLGLKFQTYIAAGPVGPSITSVQNNSSRIADGLPNSGIAPSSIFVIVGSGMADPVDPVLQSSVPPGLPLTLNGASLTVTVNGTVVHPPIYYTSPGQIAAVLPAATPAGAGSLTVTYKGVTSAPFPIQVVPSALGINTYNGDSGVVTDAITGALISVTNSATPGEVLTIWATGLGADPDDSDSIYTLTPHKINVPLHVYIAGVEANVSYAGASIYPGVNQINVTVPDSIPTGCYVSMAAVVGAQLNHSVTIPVKPGGGSCIDAVNGITGDQITPQNGGAVRAGLVTLVQTNTPTRNGRSISNVTDAAFEKYTGFYVGPNGSVSPGSCIIDVNFGPSGSIAGLDVGTITLKGPAGLDVTLARQPVKGAFASDLPGPIPDQGGSYTFTGTRGADVGSFSVTINLSPLISWTNPDDAANIDRSKSLLVKWTGGNPGSFVHILGSTTINRNQTTTYSCVAHDEDGQFTVPAYILSALPASAIGGTQIQNIILIPFNADGLDGASADATVQYAVSSVYK